MRTVLTSFIFGLACFGVTLPLERPHAAEILLAQSNEAEELENSADEESEADQTAGDPVKPQTAPVDGTEIGPENPPDIISDLSTIPFPVKKMRDLIHEAAISGDLEKLRPYIGYGDDVTMLSLGGFEEDPIDFLKSLSGDEEGQEILAIISEILEAPLVRLNSGRDDEMYVWPYFYAYPAEKLTPAQRVQLFRIITYGDYEEMVTFGNYIFYRIGITPQGRWRFFVAGD